jgi:polyhydroxybutyrate depolymerase
MPCSHRLLAGSLVLPTLLAMSATLRAQTEPTETRHTVRVDGRERSYVVHAPAVGAAGLPLVLVFHGAGASARGMARHTGFSALARHEGFMVAYPEGIDHRWSDGRGYGAEHDDVGFVRALLDTLQHRFPIDPRRIYATGISNGAMFTYRLVCELPGVFAAIAPVAGAMPDTLVPTCARTPVSIAAFQGTADPLVPYEGGGVVRRRGQVLSAMATIQLWAGTDGCTAAPVSTLEPDRAPSDGMRVKRTVYTGCTTGREVVLYTIEGGGHTWPGGPASGPSIGRVTHDIGATSTIWTFFSTHPRP